MTHVACDEKLRSVVRSSMHPCPVNWVPIGRAVVYHAPAAQAFNAEFKCRHCTIVPVCSCSHIGYVRSSGSKNSILELVSIL